GIRDDLVTGVQTCALPISRCSLMNTVFRARSTAGVSRLTIIGAVAMNNLQERQMRRHPAGVLREPETFRRGAFVSLMFDPEAARRRARPALRCEDRQLCAAAFPCRSPKGGL